MGKAPTKRKPRSANEKDASLLTSIRDTSQPSNGDKAERKANPMPIEKYTKGQRQPKVVIASKNYLSSDSLSELTQFSSDESFTKSTCKGVLTKRILQTENALLKEESIKSSRKKRDVLLETIHSANKRTRKINTITNGELIRNPGAKTLLKNKHITVEIPKNKITFIRGADYNVKKQAQSLERGRQQAAYVLQRTFRLWMLHKTNCALRKVSKHISLVTRQALSFQKGESSLVLIQALVRARLTRQRIAFIRSKREAAYTLQRFFRLWMLYKANCELRKVSEYISLVTRQALSFQKGEAALVLIQALVRSRLARQRVALIREKRIAAVIPIQFLIRIRLLRQRMVSIRAARVLQAAWIRLKLRRATQHCAAGVIQTFFRMVIAKAAFLREKLQQAVNCKDAHVKGMAKNNRLRSCIAVKPLPDVITELNTMKNARTLRPVTFIDVGTRCPENIKAVNAEPDEQLSIEMSGRVRFGGSTTIIDPVSLQPASFINRSLSGPSILRNSASAFIPLPSPVDDPEPLRILRFQRARPQRENSHKGAYTSF